MSTHDDDRGGLQQPGRSGQPQQPGEPGRPQQYGPPPHYGQPGQQYGQPGQPYAGAQPPYDGQQYQPSPYGQGQPYGQPTGYAQPYGGQPPYGQYGQYGFAATPAKPAPVVVAAVLGLVFSAIGTLVTIGLVAGGALLGALVDDLAAADPTVGELDSGAVTGVLVVLAVLALVWTVLMIWGSVWALTGRTRVLLLVGGAITVAVTGFFVVAGLAGASTGDVGGGEVVFFLLFFLAALAIVVLLALRPAAQYFAAHRVRRGR